MKKQLIALGAVCAATLAIYGASDRIDVYNKAGQFVSVMVDDITEITVGKAADGQGYSTVNIKTTYGDKSRDISEVSEIKYSPIEERKAHDIFMVNDEHAKIRLLDWRNNTDIYGTAQIDPTKPDDWRGCWAGGNPHFLIDTDKGFVSEFSVSGTYTGKVYTDNPNFIFWSPKEFNQLGMDSYSFDMPFEPVEIKTSSFELDTYDNAPFIGTYKGYNLKTKEKRIAHKAESTLSVEIKGNTTYVITSTDNEGYNVLDLYTWDETKNTISYVPYEGEARNPLTIDVKYGLTGKFADGDLLFATMHNIIEDKYEETVRYFATKGDIEFSVACADEYNQRMLVQAVATNGSARYFFYDAMANYPVELTMDWIYGDNIGADSQAYAINPDGEKLFRYDYRGQGNEPEFTFRGLEYGTYTGAGAELKLDGFSSCTLGDAEGTYVIDGGVVTVTIGDTDRIFAIDRSAKTYVETVSDSWDGQESYTLTTARGAFRGGELKDNNSMSVTFNKDLKGDAAPGKAAIKFTVKRTDGFSGSDGISDICTYIYDAANKTVIITNVYMGTSAYTTGKGSITLKLSDDKYSLWVDDSESDRIFAPGNINSYLLTGPVNTMTAPKPEPVKLAAKYTGAPEMEAFGNKTPTETVLTFDEATGKATLSIKGMGASLINSTVDYTVEGNTVTLKQVSAYDPTQTLYPVAKKVDIVYTVGEDGKLTTSQTIAGSASNMVITINLSSAPLIPEVVEEPTPEPEPVKLAAKYTGAPEMEAFGNKTPTETVLTFDEATGKATLSIKGMGASLINSTVDYTVEGNTVTLKQVSAYDPNQTIVPVAKKVDIVYTVGEDGKLTTSQTIAGSASNMVININLSSAPLVPAE